VGDLCPSGVDAGLIDGTRCQGNQKLTNTITRKGSKRLVVVHKLHQAHTLAAEVQVVNGRAVNLQRKRLTRLD